LPTTDDPWADRKLSEAQKKAAIDGFAAQVMRQVY